MPSVACERHVIRVGKSIEGRRKGRVYSKYCYLFTIQLRTYPKDDLGYYTAPLYDKEMCNFLPGSGPVLDLAGKATVKERNTKIRY